MRSFDEWDRVRVDRRGQGREEQIAGRMHYAFAGKSGDCMAEWMNADFASLAWMGMSGSFCSQDSGSTAPDHTQSHLPLSVIFDFFHRASSWSAAGKFRKQLSAKTARLWGWVVRY